jgi:hypothetical protein
MHNIEVTSESVKPRKLSASKIARSKIFPDGVDSLKSEDLPGIENSICDDWAWYMEELKAKKFALVNPASNGLCM